MRKTVPMALYRELRDDLADALEGLRELRTYVDPYFIQKHDLEDFLADATDALADADVVLAGKVAEA